jgi:hypothetical protein
MTSPDGSPAIKKTVGGVGRQLARRRQMRGKAPGGMFLMSQNYAFVAGDVPWKIPKSAAPFDG